MNFMLRFGKRLGCAGLMLVTAYQAAAFSLLGPIGNGGDAYQVFALSYNLPNDIGAPKNLGEEYRITTPVLYWAADSTFLDYFGSNGLAAAEQAFSLYNRLTNVSSYSQELSEFPLRSGAINYTAQALQLMDLKSAIMGLTIEHLGLADPDRWTWALRARIPTPATCIFEYHIIMRNFDPVTWEPSRYVNGTQYSWVIDEFCPVIDRGDAVEVIVDPLTVPSSAIAAYQGYYVYTQDPIFGGLFVTSGGLQFGTFYTTFTRDDVGGLRYLYRASNINFEDVPTDTLQFVTNTQPQLLFGSNLTLLAAQSLTNTAAQLQALYPGLVVTSTSNYFVTSWVTNLTAYFTNYPWMPIGSFPQLVISTNRTLTVQTLFRHTFENLAVLELGPNGFTARQAVDFTGFTNRAIVTYQTISVTNNPWLPVNSPVLVTNVTSRSFVTNGVVGEFFILPTNSCAISVLDVPLTNVVVSTNFLVISTNDPTVINTNVPGGFTNAALFSYQAVLLDYFTNHAIVVLPVSCETNAPSLRQGVERIRFIRRDFDSLLGRFFEPITNDYSMVALVSNAPVVQNFRRIITAPDIQLTAADLDLTFADRSINFRSNSIGGLAGPGTIEPFMTMTFNKVGPLQIIVGPGDEANAITNFQWASFDASTNPPIIYPNGTSIKNMEALLMMQVAPTSSLLPDGTVGQLYEETFDEGFLIAGGQPPYTWTVVSGLPEGMMLAAGTNTASATLSGAPTRPGLYQLGIRITEAGGRSVTRQYTLRINR